VGAPARRSRSASALALLSAALLLIAIVAGYASSQLFDSDHFADRATSVLDDSAVRSEIATRVTDDVVINADSNLVAFRPVIESVVDGVVGGGAFQSLFRSAVRDVHRSIFHRNRDSVTLTLLDAGTVIRGALQVVQPKVAKKIPGGANLEIEKIDPPPWLPGLLRLADKIGIAQWLALGLSVLLAAAALWLSPDRRRTTLRFATTLVVLGVLGAVALGVGEAVLARSVDAGGDRDAARAVWNAFLGDLGAWMYLLAGAGAVVAAAASSLLQPIEVEAPLRKLAGWLTAVPSSGPKRAARAIALIVVGVSVVLEHDAVLRALVILAGLYIAYIGVLELLRLTLPETGTSASVRGDGMRSLVAGGVAVVAIVIAGAVLSAGGGTSQSPASVVAGGCNGSPDLCDRPLDQVAFPSTHNSMSAATNPGWLFAQQEAGIPQQMADGIRGLLIDAHYGIPTKSGRVKTDLLAEGAKGEEVRKTLGPAATDAALRIRDRIVNSPAAGPRGVYFCHGFCEPGALPVDQVFGEIRDFLAAHTGQVLVLDIEDYVRPADIAAAAERTGLIDYIYKGPLDPMPNMQDVAGTGSRAVVMAENESGGTQFPWYHPAYEQLLQETPYSFDRPAQLIDPNLLPASCAPNRGPTTAPLFLLNHWIDTSPAPRPTNAQKVNRRDVLLRRIHRCEKIRGLQANLVAVDFYKTGDLFGVTDELNAERADP
jgi:hypothetical protein